MLNTKFSSWPSFTSEEADSVRDVLLSNKLSGEVMNIGNDTEPISLEALAFKIIKISGEIIVPEFIPYSSSDRDLGREVFNRIPSIEKIKNIQQKWD